MFVRVSGRLAQADMESEPSFEMMVEDLTERRALRLGELFRTDLKRALAPFEIVKEVRGAGLLCGIEFTAPRRLGLRAFYEAFHQIHPAMFGQMLVMRLFRSEKILTQMCGNRFMVLKTAPPLVASEEQIRVFVGAAERVVSEMHNSGAFWTESLSLARRAVNVD